MGQEERQNKKEGALLTGSPWTELHLQMKSAEKYLHAQKFHAHGETHMNFILEISVLLRDILLVFEKYFTCV